VFSPKPWKKLVQICAVVFKKNVITTQLRRPPISSKMTSPCRRLH